MPNSAQHIIYFHGFNSDGHGWKFQALRKYFKDYKVHSPDLPAAPLEVIKTIKPIVESAPDVVYFIGTSLGGFYAYYFSAAYGYPCFLFNPSVKPHQTLHRGIGTHKTFTKGRDYSFVESYLQDLKQLKLIADEKIMPTHLNFFLATDDDVLDLAPIPELFPNANSLQWYDKVGHGFSQFREVLPQVEKLMIDA